ncbi:hypothetical protein ACFU9O_02215 [Streptomyces albidoflavus]
MTRTGPQKYPGASTTYWYGGSYKGSEMETNVIVWHSTEGTALPSYGGGASAPTLTAVPDFARKKLVWYQHFDFDVSSRALVNKAGGVETNTLNVCQVEVVGTCDPATHAKWQKAGRQHLYMPELPDWVVRDLAAFAKWAHEQHGVPLSSGLTFRAYPASYGASSVRMTGARWNSFKGHCGHQHVPENDHGDPGAFPMAAILDAAKGSTPEKGLDMTDEQLFKAVWKRDAIPAPTTASTYKTNPTWKAESYFPHLAEQLSRLTDKVDALTKAVAELKKGA